MPQRSSRIQAGSQTEPSAVISTLFREIFWDTEHRSAKLARLLIGVAAIVVPVSAWTLLT